jgi:short-chain 2-methylacyl-CoA dehydrogenase
VREMEAKGKLDAGLLKALFDNGLMGVEIPEEYSGTGSNFMTSILVVEEIAKVDPAVSVLVDIQNTLINSLIVRLGTKAQKEKYLTALATKSVNVNDNH